MNVEQPFEPVKEPSEPVRATFEMTISGVVPPPLLAEFGHVAAAGQETSTVLRGHFADQTEMYHFLQRLRVHALEVTEVRRIATAE